MILPFTLAPGTVRATLESELSARLNKLSGVDSMQNASRAQLTNGERRRCDGFQEAVGSVVELLPLLTGDNSTKLFAPAKGA